MYTPNGKYLYHLKDGEPFMSFHVNLGYISKYLYHRRRYLEAYETIAALEYASAH